MNDLHGSLHQFDAQRKDQNAVRAAPSFGNGPTLDAARRIVARLPGGSLNETDYHGLEDRWIDCSLAERAHLRRVDSLTGAELVGRNHGNYAGIAIPYFRPGSDQVREYRLRRDLPELEYDGAGNLKPRQKYLSPPGRGNMLYFVPNVPVDLLRDVETPLVILRANSRHWRYGAWRRSEASIDRGSCLSECRESTTGGAPWG